MWCCTEMEWFRCYTRTLDSAKVQGLPLELFRAWFNLLCLARVHDGPLPSFKEIAFRLRITIPKAQSFVESLVDADLIDKSEDGSFLMHDWDEHQHVSDDVSKRVAKHREKRKRNVTVTAPEQSRADTEQSRAELTPSARAFQEAVTRMIERHPKTKDNGLVPAYLIDAVKIQPLEKIEECHAAWCDSDGWQEKGGRFAPTLASWLYDRGYAKFPKNGDEGRMPYRMEL